MTIPVENVLQVSENVVPPDPDGQETSNHLESSHETGETTDENATNASTPDIFIVAGRLYDDLMAGSITIESLYGLQVLQDINQKLKAAKDAMQTKRTAKLWQQYMEMVSILQLFIKAERTGNWALHLKSMQDMLPYLAAAGHTNYTNLFTST